MNASRIVGGFGGSVRDGPLLQFCGGGFLPVASEGGDFAADATGIHHAPAGRLEERVDQFGAGFGLVNPGIRLGGQPNQAFRSRPRA
jgi:hypothetical protein